MKKAKLMLAGIACMAVIGGAFAYNAKRGPIQYFTKNVAGTACVFVAQVTLNPAAPLRANAYTTNVPVTTTILPATYCTQSVRIVPEP